MPRRPVACLPLLLALAATPAGAAGGWNNVTGSAPLATNVAAAVAAQPAADPSVAGLWLVDTGAQALRVRDALIDAATGAIDAQYYIWNADASGRYLAARLLTAAGRGVRVRILLDDANVAGRDAVLAALAAHPNVAIRVYNPTPARGGLPRLLSFLRDFGRLNRRMHIKSFTVDGLVTVVGGRNIGDEYFDLDREVNFRDRELLAVGPVVAGVAAGFEAFWSSPFSQPAASLAGAAGESPAEPDTAGSLADAAAAIASLGYQPDRQPVDYLYGTVLRSLTFAPARLVLDPPPDPATAAEATTPQPVARALQALVDGAREELLVESAYFILGDESLRAAAALAARGVRLRALTNSLASNDLVTNHSGYARRRPAMLAAGIDLYELRPDAAACRRLVEYSQACGAAPAFSLHSKSLVVDRRVVYVGSFNLNLRSAYLNAETALIVESPALAARVANAIGELMAPASSWRVARTAGGQIRWQTAGAGDGLVEATAEPATGAWRRLQSRLYRLLPMEKYL